ncbi:MAG: hypothetical protein CMB97_00335 [Flavobacteriaceae bacterium]|nr:hypothetical protein [Flavobacteriaceae bacterium]
MSILYKSTLPSSVRASYTENENVSFRLSFEGQEILQNSVRICGKLVINNIDTDTTYDALVGVHGVWSGVSVECDKRGMIENLRALPRWMKMSMEARQNDTEALSNSINVTSLTLARDNQTRKFLDGVKTVKYLPFASRINCCLNNTDNPISWSRTGAVTLNVRLSSMNQFLTKAGANTTYELQDLELMYQTRPESSKAPIKASSYYMVKHTLDSQQSSIQTKIPNNVASVSCSFILASRENSNDYSNWETALLPGVERVQFTINQSQSLIRFNLKSEQEILYNYLVSMGVRDLNNIRVSKLNNDKSGYGIGMNMYRPISESIGFECVSTVDNTSPTSMYMFFRTVLNF